MVKIRKIGKIANRFKIVNQTPKHISTNTTVNSTGIGVRIKQKFTSIGKSISKITETNPTKKTGKFIKKIPKTTKKKPTKLKKRKTSRQKKKGKRGPLKKTPSSSSTVGDKLKTVIYNLCIFVYSIIGTCWDVYWNLSTPFRLILFVGVTMVVVIGIYFFIYFLKRKLFGNIPTLPIIKK